MYRIIIADDEPLIIRGLKKMMEWGKMDTEVVGEAGDGEQQPGGGKQMTHVRPRLMTRKSAARTPRPRRGDD